MICWKRGFGNSALEYIEAKRAFCLSDSSFGYIYSIDLATLVDPQTIKELAGTAADVQDSAILVELAINGFGNFYVHQVFQEVPDNGYFHNLILQ